MQPLIDGTFVIDGVSHAYNLLPANHRAGHYARSLTRLMHGMHRMLTPEGWRVAETDWERNWTPEELAHMLFVESDVDIATHHVLALDTLYYDGLCSYEKTLECKQRWPDRFLVYAGVDPLEGPAALEKLEQQVEELQPQGLKLYPASWLGESFRHTGWRMDDPTVAFPIFERARRLGIKNIAVHKSLPMGAVPIDPYKVADVAHAADVFPDLNFEVVHGGMSFLDEISLQISLFPNVYVNLEVVGGLVVERERWFGEVLAGLLKWAGPDKIFWGTGAVLMHPQPALEKFWYEYQLPDDLVEVAGIQLTPEIKRKILSENYARFVGLDIEAAKDRIAEDEFAQKRREWLAKNGWGAR